MSRTETASTIEQSSLPPSSTAATNSIPSPAPSSALDDVPVPKPASDAAPATTPALDAVKLQSSNDSDATLRPPADAAHEETPAQAPSSSATIDMEQFNQILDLDGEDPECEFSASMVGAYFGQATTTFKEMEEALTAKDLSKLSELGHFLKGSSAQLGVSRVQVSCEKIQHYGQLKDQEKNIDLTDVEALDKIGALMDTVKYEYDTAEAWLTDYFKQKGVAVLVEEAD